MTNDVLTKPPTRSIDPEWLRVPDSVKFSGLSRSLLYNNFDIAGGKILTRCVRQRNKIRGVRLVNVDSLRKFIEEGGDQ